MTIPFMYNFRSLFNKFPNDFLKFNFAHFTAQVRLFFVQKWIPKTFRFKNVWRGIGKILTFVISSIASKIFGK